MWVHLGKDTSATSCSKGICLTSHFANAQIVLDLSWALNACNLGIADEAIAANTEGLRNSSVAKAQDVLEIFWGSKACTFANTASVNLSHS